MDADALNDLVRVSRRAGVWELAQAGGGNTSIKRGGRLYVKASGLRLRDIDASGFVDVETAWLRERVRDGREMPIPSPGPRPSIETWMHALLDEAMVHTHPIAVNAWLCVGGLAAAEVFRRFDPVVIPYVTPGFPLAQAIARAAEDHRALHGGWPRVILLENHGLITSAPALDEAAALTERVVACAAESIGGPLASVMPDRAALDTVLRARAGPAARRICQDPVVTAACHDPRGRSWFCDAPLFPDQVVYCGPSAVWIDRGDDVEAAMQEYESRIGLAAQVVAIAGAGVVIEASSHAALESADEVLRAHVYVSMMGERVGTLRRLSAENVSHLMGWEAETYRRSLDRPPPAQG